MSHDSMHVRHWTPQVRPPGESCLQGAGAKDDTLMNARCEPRILCVPKVLYLVKVFHVLRAHGALAQSTSAVRAWSQGQHEGLVPSTFGDRDQSARLPHKCCLGPPSGTSLGAATWACTMSCLSQ
jgi:hypothetical protein